MSIFFDSMLYTMRPFFVNMPGTPLYFQDSKKQLNAMLREGHNLPVSVPTWFATFSAGDTYWPELFKTVYLTLSDEQIKMLNSVARTTALTDFPEYVAHMFWSCWHAFFKHILNGFFFSPWWQQHPMVLLKIIITI